MPRLDIGGEAWLPTQKKKVPQVPSKPKVPLGAQRAEERLEATAPPKPRVPTLNELAAKAQQRGGTTAVASGALPPSESGRGAVASVRVPTLDELAAKAQQRGGAPAVIRGEMPPSESGRGVIRPRVPVVPTVPAQPKPAPVPATQTAPQPAPQQQQPAQPPVTQPPAAQPSVPGYGAEQAQGTLPAAQDLGQRMVQFGEFVQSLLNTSTPDTVAMISALQEQYLSELSNLQQTITRMFQEQMGGLDPATQAALTQLRQTVEEQRRQLWDEMNRRGLLQSGIALEMIDRLQRNQLTAEQQLIANQFRSLQQQMNQALLGFAQQRLAAVKEFGLAGIQAAERQALTAQDIRWRALQMGFSLAQAEQAAQQWERQFGFQQQQWQTQVDQWLKQFQAQQEQWLKEFQFQQQQWQQQYGLQKQQLSLQQQQLYQPPSPDEQLKQSAYQKLQAGATFDQLTEGEKIAIGYRPWQAQTAGISEEATNYAIAEITTLTPVERYQLFQDPEKLRALAEQGVDIEKLRKVYEQLPKPYPWQR